MGNMVVFTGPRIYAHGFTGRVQDAAMRDWVRHHLTTSEQPLEVAQMVLDPWGGIDTGRLWLLVCGPNKELKRAVLVEHDDPDGVVYSHPRCAERDSLERHIAS